MQDDQVQRLRFSIAVALALSLHGAVAFAGFARLYELEDFARSVQAGMQQRIHASIQVALEREPEPPPPPPEPEAPAPEPEPPPQATPKPAPKEPTRAPEPPAPAAAQAGRVLTAEPDPDEPVDLTGMTIVQGNADAYAGGVTAANGTSARAVRAPSARAEGVQGGTGTAPAVIDRSRRALPKQGNWDCPFPPDAERMNYDVNVLVSVSAAGKVVDARPIGDQNPAYARAAVRCALDDKAFDAAFDRGGAAIASTFPMVIHFRPR